MLYVMGGMEQTRMGALSPSFWVAVAAIAGAALVLLAVSLPGAR